MTSSSNLHIFFLPFLSPGHMIPMVDLANIFAGRGVKATIVTTTANAPLINTSPQLSIQLLILDVPSSAAENVTALPTPELTSEFVSFIDSLKDPFLNLLNQHHPDFIISDVFYPWSADLGVRRLAFSGTSSFCSVVLPIASKLVNHGTVSDDDGNKPLVVPGIPHCIEIFRSEVMGEGTMPDDLYARISRSFSTSYGMVMNTFYELEPEYASMINYKVWHLGPVSLCNGDAMEMAARGGGSVESFGDCLNWLESRKSGSVVYVCFGSLGQFSPLQLREIAVGLEAADWPFVWVVRNCRDKAEWMPEGFEERVLKEGKSLIVTEWAAQVLILGHPAVGGFMTHCGWNSCLEGLSAGLPMITWPLFMDQFFNEKLLVNILKIGVPIGAKVSTLKEEKRNLVKGEEVKKAVNELMGNTEEANERRKRAKELAEMAKKAVEEGGSSYNDVSRLIQELMDVKAGEVEKRESLVQD